MNIHRSALAAILLTGGLLFSGGAYAENELTRTDLLEHDIEASGYEVVQVKVDFARGATATKHTHPGEEIAFVIEGKMIYRLEGREPVTLQAGQAIFIPSGVPHSAENIGQGSSSELATYVVRKGEPIYVPTK